MGQIGWSKLAYQSRETRGTYFPSRPPTRAKSGTATTAFRKTNSREEITLWKLLMAFLGSCAVSCSISNGLCPRFYDMFFPNYETAGPTQDQITSLANIINEARFSRKLTNELARFVSGIHACRQREFSSLLKNSPLSPLGAALRQGVLVH